MLRRQLTLMYILQELGEPISHTRLVKLAFLASVEEQVGHTLPFYEFVPYKYGPFSFALYRELGGLEIHGFVTTQNDRWQIAPRMKAQTKELVEALPTAVKNSLNRIVQHYGQIAQQTLLKTVYRRFPWFTIHSDLRELVPPDAPRRPSAPPAIYTIGYEGRSIDGFMNTLLQRGIRHLIDVRANPLSRKYGFSKQSLSEICSKLHVNYSHRPELGIKSKERVSLDSYDSYQTLLDRYTNEMLPNRVDAVRNLINEMKKSASALLCVEADVNCCHRGRLALQASAVSHLPIEHL